MKTKCSFILLALAAFLQKTFGQVVAKSGAAIGGTRSDQLIKLCNAKDGGVLYYLKNNKPCTVQKVMITK